MLKFFRKKKGLELTDLELYQAYQQGHDLEKLGILYERYIELLYGLCLKYLKHEPDAEDAVMQIFETLIEKGKNHEIQNFKSWLYVLAKNHCLMQLRKNSRKTTYSVAPEIMQSSEEKHHTVEPDPFAPEQNGQETALKSCIEQLSREQKACVKAFYFEEKSYKEIAQDQGKPLGKIRSYIQNGRRNLKICIEKEQKISKGKTNISSN